MTVARRAMTEWELVETRWAESAETERRLALLDAATEDAGWDWRVLGRRDLREALAAAENRPWGYDGRDTEGMVALRIDGLDPWGLGVVAEELRRYGYLRAGDARLVLRYVNWLYN